MSFREIEAMSQTEQTPAPPAAPAAEVAGPPASAKPVKTKPKTLKVLPTERVAFAKQMEVLRAFGQLGANGVRVTNTDVAGVVGMHPNTVGLANGFFLDIGLLQRAPDGQIAPQPVIDFARSYQWNPETAAYKLADHLTSTWFGQALVPKVDFRVHSIQEAITVLADAAGAAPSHRGQLESILAMLAAAGLVALDGDAVRPVRRQRQPKDAGPPDDHPAPPPGGATFGTGPTTAPGAFQFAMSVTLAEIGLLPPDRIKAFFDGIAEVMKIKAEIENTRKGAAGG